MDEIVHRGSGMNEVSGLMKSFIDMRQFPETPGESRKVPFLLGNWIAGFKGKVDGN